MIMAELRAHLRTGRMTSYVSCYVVPELKTWLDARAKAGPEGTRRSDVLRWLIEQAMEKLPAGSPERAGRSSGMTAYINAYVPDEMNTWVAETAAGFGVKKSDVLRWLIEAERAGAVSVRRSRRDVIAS